MKVRLLYPDEDVDLSPRLPEFLRRQLDDDLELARLYQAMAAGDSFLLEVAQRVVPLSETDPANIVYRQHVLADCMANRDVVQRMYAIAVDGDEVRRKAFMGGIYSPKPSSILRAHTLLLKPLLETLRELRSVCDEQSRRFRSVGFRRLFAMIGDQLPDEYLQQLEDHLGELDLPRGTLLSARLGLGHKGRNLMLHVPTSKSWWDRLTGNRSGYGFRIPERDEAGAQALADLEGKALNDIANTVAQSADHVRGFFGRLRTELGFYIGCLNLHDRLAKAAVPMCFPEPALIGTRAFCCRDLRDVGLCLTIGKPVTGNDVNGDGASLMVITGANEGGKSTFLRSLGAAQVMMQAGMFVTAASLRANVTNRVFTHFKHEEDQTMTHGKFDEELARMSTIIDFIEPESMLLCNESFASTDEREGSEIARGIVDALLACQIKLVYVTHMYELAQSLHTRHTAAYVFLRAERRPDGVRTFRMKAGPPQPTSHGQDSLRRVFGAPARAPNQRAQYG
jgi:hypothetical protein